MTIIEIVRLVVFFVAMIIYLVIKYTKLPVATKDIVRVCTGFFAVVIVYFGLFSHHWDYVYGFATAKFIFASFYVGRDE